MGEQYFVYYEDDYPENDGIGMEKFNTENQATKFIEERLKTPGAWKDKTLDCYTLVKGTELNYTQKVKAE